LGGNTANTGRQYRQKKPLKLAVIMLDGWRDNRQLAGQKMTDERQSDNQNEAGLTRRGKIVYESNPSVAGRLPVRIGGAPTKRGGQAYMIATDTGEVVGRGAFAFVEETEIDSEQFVKVYLAGIKQYAELSKAGALLFEFVYKEISGRAGKDKDTININYFLAQKWMAGISRRTYERGLAELLDKEFLFRSISAEIYFVNIRFMFNGDRLALVKTYRRKGSSLQAELPLDVPAKLPPAEAP
jgi:hypothetical protein